MANQIEKWNPFGELRGIQQRLASLFGDDVAGETALGVTSSDWAPAVDISEDDKEFVITADLPDVAKEDVKVQMENGVLSISGVRQHESEEKNKKKKFHRIERSFGSYTRSFCIPEGVEANSIDAKFKNGVLTVHLPKSPVSKPREIEVQVH